MLLKDKQRWQLHEGDAIQHMLTNEKEGGMPAKSVDLAVFSPPFSVIIFVHQRIMRHWKRRGLEA